MGPFGQGCWPGLSIQSIHAALSPNTEEQRGLHSRVPHSKRINSVCNYGKHTHTHHTLLQPTRLGRISLGRSLALSLSFIEGTSLGPFHWSPVTEKVSRGGYLKSDVERLEMTLQVFQLNEAGCVHRLAVHKGGWKHDSERGKHEICHPNPGSLLP